MQLIDENGKMPKGFEILLKSLFKMLNLDPELIVRQINDIADTLRGNRERQELILSQQAEILGILKKEDKHVSDQ